MIDRNEAIERIRRALRARSGKSWSVTGGRGTAWGWITIDAPPARRRFLWTDGGAGERFEPAARFGHMGPDDRAELARLLGLDRAVHHQGEQIPAGSDYREEYVARAEGRAPERYGRPYWD